MDKPAEVLSSLGAEQHGILTAEAAYHSDCRGSTGAGGFLLLQQPLVHCLSMQHSAHALPVLLARC